MVLNRENNINSVHAEIVNRRYSHVFTNSKIALSKIFKQHLLDYFLFTTYLCLLIINEIHLVKEWDKHFQLIYTKIKKVRKKISYHILFLEILAILIEKVRQNVVEKAGFPPNYWLL